MAAKVRYRIFVSPPSALSVAQHNDIAQLTNESMREARPDIDEQIRTRHVLSDRAVREYWPTNESVRSLPGRGVVGRPLSVLLYDLGSQTLAAHLLAYCGMAAQFSFAAKPDAAKPLPIFLDHGIASTSLDRYAQALGPSYITPFESLLLTVLDRGSYDESRPVVAHSNSTEASWMGQLATWGFSLNPEATAALAEHEALIEQRWQGPTAASLTGKILAKSYTQAL